MSVAVTAPVRLANLGARGLFSLSSAVRTYAHLQRFCPFYEMAVLHSEKRPDAFRTMARAVRYLTGPGWDGDTCTPALAL